MKTTLDLLAHVKQTLEISERALSIKLGHSPTNITSGKQSGSLSPVLAGQLAELVGQSVQHWMSVAYLESQPKTRVTDHLRRVLHAIA